jgi:antitoxin HicB
MSIKEYTYTVIFQPLEEGGYQVIVPALPEIVTAGRTIEEAREMAQDAIRCAIEGLIEDRQPIPSDLPASPLTEQVRVSVGAA